MCDACIDKQIAKHNDLPGSHQAPVDRHTTCQAFNTRSLSAHSISLHLLMVYEIKMSHTITTRSSFEQTDISPMTKVEKVAADSQQCV